MTPSTAPLTASAVAADTMLLRVTARPPDAHDDTELLELPPTGPPSPGAALTDLPRPPADPAADTDPPRPVFSDSAARADTDPPRPLSASAAEADTALLRAPSAPSSRRISDSDLGSLVETQAAQGRFELTHDTGQSLGRGDETVVRSDLSFSGLGAPSEALQAVLSRGRIGRFMLLRELGRGAMGVVFAAYDEELDRKVAIKLLHESRGHDASHGRSMLLREAQAMARLAHPNVVAVHEVGVVEGAVFVAMEYVAGVDLQRWLDDQPRPWREVVAMLRQAGAGLVAAHREGLIHRDFKPSNVLVGEDGRVRVADFGLATRRGAAHRRGAAGRERAPLTATLAPEGALVGTPVYMAPELLRGGSATALSDQFAFCVALYEGLHGARPFDGDTLARLTEVVESRPLPATPPNPEVPAWLHAAVCRGLARSPGDRFPSLEALVELLGRDPEAERRQRRRRALQIAGLILGTAAIVALLVLAWSAVGRWAEERRGEARLAALRDQIGELRELGARAEAARLLQAFVALPENHGLPVVARAYLEWAAAEDDPDAAVDAYASAYITARAPVDRRVALRGLIDRLGQQNKVPEAAAALAVLERAAPEAAAAPELQKIRLSAALLRRDLATARAVLAGGDEDGWSPVLQDLLQTTEHPIERFGGALDLKDAEIAALDFDGVPGDEVVSWAGRAALRVHRADPSLEPRLTVDLGDARWVRALSPVVAGEPLVMASYATDQPPTFDLRLLAVDPGGATRTLLRWPDSFVFHPRTVDLDRDGEPEVYVGTEAYVRQLWRLDRADDGTWSQRSAHRPTSAAASDITTVLTADLDDDGRDELAVTAGPWRAYDLRAFKPTAGGGLDLIARRSFGSFRSAAALRGPGGDLVALIKADFQVGPGRFPPDKPLGEPAGLYLVGLRGGALETLAYFAGEPSSDGTSNFGQLFPGDLDGDGQDELVIDLAERGMMLLRWRPGQPLRPLVLGGLRPALVHDLDADGRVEILAQPLERPDRMVLLGAGDTPLAPLPVDEVEPRPVPPGVTDPAIADAWAHGEQLVAIGLPRRTADELSAIARLSGQVAPRMLSRAAELYAELGEDALAAEHYVAAAAWPEAAAPALAGAAAARRRLGEFPAAEELTRQRLALADLADRPAVEAELAALQAVTAPRPEMDLTFREPLDPRWRVVEPVAMRRDIDRGQLALWAMPAPVIAEFPVEWDGGPIALEVDLEADQIEWGVKLAIQLVTPDGQPWLSAALHTEGVTVSPHTTLWLSEAATEIIHIRSGPTGRARLAAYPGLDTLIATLDSNLEQRRAVRRLGAPPPPPGPLLLRLRADLVQQGFVGRLWIPSIRLTGCTPGDEPLGPPSPAWLLAEGETGAALALLGDAAPGSERHMWRIDALLGLGRIDEAVAEIKAALASGPPGGPAHRAVQQRLRRPYTAERLASRAAFGPQLIDVLFDPTATLVLRPDDVEEVLIALPDPDPDAADPDSVQRLVMTEFARGLALVRAGRRQAARAAFAAALAGIDRGVEFPLRERIHPRVLSEQLSLSAAMHDRDAALRSIRALLGLTQTPHLTLERVQSDPAVVALLGPDTFARLQAELRR